MWYFHNSSIIGLLIIHLYNCYCRVPKEISAICGQYYPMNIFCHGYLLRKKKNINHLLRKMRNILPSKLIAYIYVHPICVSFKNWITTLFPSSISPWFIHSNHLMIFYMHMCMPRLASLVPRVLVDVSSVKALCILWYPRGDSFI